MKFLMELCCYKHVFFFSFQGTLFHHYGSIWLLFTFFLCHNCSLHERSIAMIVIDVFFSLTIIVFGLGHALAGEIIVDFGEHFILLKSSTENCVGWIVNKMGLASNSIRVVILHHKLKLQLFMIDFYTLW